MSKDVGCCQCQYMMKTRPTRTVAAQHTLTSYLVPKDNPLSKYHDLFPLGSLSSANLTGKNFWIFGADGESSSGQYPLWNAVSSAEKIVSGLVKMIFSVFPLTCRNWKPDKRMAMAFNRILMICVVG
jgi:hypothetical protein